MHNIEIISCPKIGAQYKYIKHKSGLSIYVCEMEGFSTTEALFGTKYGSINTQFKTKQETDYCCVPEGIAHFLEHKLFENEDCDVFDLYAKTGANANAFTSFDKTCYLFSCSDHYKESLEILLSFVQSPYFTKESVQKEQGIIGQEIRMYDDDPGWNVFFNMLKGLYHNHPVKIDIAGTVESIAEITPELLYQCYHTFYNLHNMVLSVAGNCKAEAVLEIADRLLKPCENMELECVFPEEPADIVCAETVAYAPIGTTMFQLGFKCKPETGFADLKKELIADLTIRTIKHTASPLYQSLLRDNLINDTFSSEIFNGDGFFTVIFEGESERPQEVRDRIFAAIAEAAENGLDKELFEELRKSTYGGFVRKFNNVEAVANLMINGAMSDVNPFDMVTALSELTIDEANAWLREELLPERATLSIMKNKTES